MYSYIYPNGPWVPGLVTAYTGDISQISETRILNHSIPPGHYIFYFGIDLSPNRGLDVDNLFYTSFSIEIVP